MTSNDLPQSRLWTWRVLILAIVLAAFWPLCGAEFSWWDDQLTIHQNAQINTPSFATVAYYWTHYKDGLYVPVTYTVWAALAKIAYIGDPGEEGIFLNSWFFHSTNVALHLTSALLAFEILRRLIARRDAAFIGALFFGLHPVQVEPVGWVSGMKDVLCWTFALSMVLVYVSRVQSVQTSGKPLWKSIEMPACALLLALGILSKPTAMVTPAALLMLDGLLLRKQWTRPILELTPLFLISAIGAVIARHAQNIEAVVIAPVWQRPFIAGDNITFYLAKILWPAQLCIDYARRVDRLTASPLLYVKWILPVALVALAMFFRKRSAFPIAGLALFLIGFAPVSGLATFQMQNISFTTDHYLYFSIFGIALMVSWAVTCIPKAWAYALAGVILAALASRSFWQTGAWQNNIKLFEWTVASNPGSAVARNNLAAMYMGGFKPRNDLAEPLLEQAVALQPKLAMSWGNLGRVRNSLGKYEQALEALDRAWKLMQGVASPPERANLARSYATVMISMDRIGDAIQWAEKADQLSPNEHATRQLLAMLKTQAATRPSGDPATKPTANLVPADGSASGR